MEAVKVRIQTQPGFANTLREGAPKILHGEGWWGYVHELVWLYNTLQTMFVNEWMKYSADFYAELTPTVHQAMNPSGEGSATWVLLNSSWSSASSFVSPKSSSFCMTVSVHLFFCLPCSIVHKHLPTGFARHSHLLAAAHVRTTSAWPQVPCL